MREYIELIILTADDEQSEIATAFLSDFPFDSFDTHTTTKGVELHAFILSEEWRVCRDEALRAIDGYGTAIEERTVEDENWNEQWEREGFEPIDIDGRMRIRAPHHTPAKGSVIDIIVAPRMAFGSGHHYTSRMMCRAIMRLTPANATLLDVGCGTGILTFAALGCGASSADAVDIDPWSVESAREAAALNGVEQRVRVLLGTIEAVEGRCYDMVVANINRNIIIADMARYAAALHKGGVLLLSGFLEEDIEAVRSAARRNDIAVEEVDSDNGWVCMACRKQC